MSDGAPKDGALHLPYGDRVIDYTAEDFSRIGERFLRLPGTPIRTIGRSMPRASTTTRVISPAVRPR